MQHYVEVWSPEYSCAPISKVDKMPLHIFCLDLELPSLIKKKNLQTLPRYSDLPYSD